MKIMSMRVPWSWWLYSAFENGYRKQQNSLKFTIYMHCKCKRAKGKLTLDVRSNSSSSNVTNKLPYSSLLENVN